MALDDYLISRRKQSTPSQQQQSTSPSLLSSILSFGSKEILPRAGNALSFLFPFTDVPDAIYKASETARNNNSRNYSNAGYAKDFLSTFLSTFANDKLQTGKGVITGQTPDKKGYGEIVENLAPNLGINQKRALGFAGEFLSDPTNLISLGSGGVGFADDGGKLLPKIVKTAEAAQDPLGFLFRKAEAVAPENIYKPLERGIDAVNSKWYTQLPASVIGLPQSTNASRGKALEELLAKQTASLTPDMAKNLPQGSKESLDLMPDYKNVLESKKALQQAEIDLKLAKTPEQRKEIRAYMKELSDDIKVRDFALDAKGYQGELNVNAQKKAAQEIDKAIFGTGRNKSTIEVSDNLLTVWGEPAWGEYFDNTIKLVNGDPDIKATALHESVHKVVDKFMSREEKDKILNQVVKKYSGQKVYRDGTLTDVVKDLDTAEEWLSENFIKYVREGKGLKDNTLMRFFEDIINRIKAVFGKKDEVDALYRRMNTGYYRNAAMKKSPIGINDLQISFNRKALKQGEKERGFVTSVKESPVVAKQVKDIINSDYKPYSDKKGLSDAEKFINDLGQSGAVDHVLSVESPTKRDAIVGQILAKMASNADDFKLADKIYTRLAEKATQAGQFNQSLHMVDKLSPEGVLNYVRKQRDKNGFQEPLAEGVAQKLQAMAKKADKLPDGVEKNLAKRELVKEITKVTKTNWQKFKAVLSSYRYDNMLSSPKTQATNALGNSIETFVTAPATRFAKGLLDAGQSTLTGKEREVYATEAGKRYIGSLSSIGEGLQNFAAVLKETKAPDNAYESSNIFSNNKIYKNTLGLGSRLLGATDEFFQTLNRGGEMEALAYRERKTGKTITDKAFQADKEAKYVTGNKELDTKNESGQGNVLATLDKATHLIQTGVRDIPGLGWFVPFVRFPMNSLKKGIEYTPGLGLSTLIGNTDKKEQIAKQIVGSVVFAGAAYLAHTGDATWNAPTSEKEKAIWKASGRQPYSIRIGDKWYSYDKLGSLSYPMAIAGALKAYYEQDPNRFTNSESKKAMNVLGGLAKYFSDQSFLQGVGDLVKASQGDAYSAARLPANFATQLIPAEALIGWVNRNFIDPIQRKPKGTVESIESIIPGLSKNLEAYKDPEGNDIKAANIAINSWSPVKVTNSNDKYDQVLEILQGGKIDKKISDVKSKANSGEIPKEKALQQVEQLQKAKTDFITEFTAKYGKAPTSGNADSVMQSLGLTPAKKVSTNAFNSKKTSIKPRKPKKVKTVKSKKSKIAKLKKPKKVKAIKVKVKKAKSYA